ncbi:MAG: L-seryl-tRNA(Sec) selenium transferase [Actinobacteria bacterium]|nr:L-seryl-tRNA(Sec) selenium transferase [Actinomycetota bacterium]
MSKQTESSQADQLRLLPQVDRLSAELDGAAPHALKVQAARRAVAGAGAAVRDGRPAPSFEDLVQIAQSLLHKQQRLGLGPVINATGVLLHTNLGRAPLSADALEAVQEVSRGYSNLEFDLTRGKRGSRYEHCAGTLTTLTGAGAALVVNNNAAAVLLALAGLCAGGEVIISRGELIEIGGEFRIPEIMTQSGAVMREVGTTNRTHLRDYENALNENTAAILRVHPSNYEVTGFTASVPAWELAKLAKRHGRRFINDVGSGLLSRQIGAVAPAWLSKEPSVTHAVKEGADLVTFSGDKLLGGPQAGIIVGTLEAVARLRRIPWLRTFRTDKTALAALDATLTAYLRGEPELLPLWRMALASAESVAERARQLASTLSQSPAEIQVTEGSSTTGGGSAPGSRIPTALLRVEPADTGSRQIADRLLAHDPPVVGRIEDAAVIVDLRTVQPHEDAVVGAALVEALGER